jgi:hypothetical protein
MPRPISVTLSVTHRPWRFPVKWVSTPEEIPAWDMSRGIHPGDARVFSGVSVEDFETLSAKARKLEVCEILEDIESEPRTPLKLSVLDFPRLVRVWPGPSTTVSPLADEDTWPRRSAFRDILALKQFMRKPGLMDAIVKVAHVHGLLDPIRGDSIDQWKRAIIEVVWCWHVLNTFQEERPDPRAVISAANDALKLTVKETWAETRAWLWIQENSLMLHELKKAKSWNTLRARLTARLRTLGTNGELDWRHRREDGVWFSLGGGLRVGALAWAHVEFAELLMRVKAGSSRCVVCGRLLEKRRGSMTCDSCRKIKSRKNAQAEAAGEPLPYPEAQSRIQKRTSEIATTVPPLKPNKAKSKPVSS